MNKPIHPADAAEHAMIPQATSFIASLFIGTGRYAKAETKDLGAARAAAKRLTAEHQSGRIAVVYAILPNGKQALVPNSYELPTATTEAPEVSAAMAALNINPTKEEPTMTTKTFGKRFNAQRAARTALKNPKAEDGKDFTTSKNSKGEWTFALGAGKAADQPKPEKAKAAKSAKAEKAAKAPKAEGAAKPKKLGARAAIEEAAKAGKLPEAPDFSAETHKRFRGKLEQVVALVKAGDVKGLKAFEINPISTSPKAIDRYRNLAVIALEAKARA